MPKKTENNFDFEKFKEYVNTYNPKTHGLNMDTTILRDMVYGLGICLDEEHYEFANGFKEFKQFLKDEIIP
jgi:hypothetical protein